MKLCGGAALGGLVDRSRAQPAADQRILEIGNTTRNTSADSRPIRLFLCGDVMTGRGIDQVLPYPSDPRLYEPGARSALEYVGLAEALHGPIPKPVDFSYVWGTALAELERAAPDARIINLETAVTTSRAVAPKAIHYRMHPRNSPTLTAARVDCAVLANNHVLDWGYAGLEETLETLNDIGIRTAGAGADITIAAAPAVIEADGKGRVLVFSYGTGTAGIPREWAATQDRAGVNLLEDLSARTVRRITKEVRDIKRPGDIVVASIHWGGNWGYDISQEQSTFAHGLIYEAGVDVIHGHSSHHVKAIEVYTGRPVIYGCGDFLTDYEGIAGYESYRDDLGLMYFLDLDPVSGKLVRLEMVPTRLKRFRIQRASGEEAGWLAGVLNREGRPFKTWAERDEDGLLTLRW